MPPRYDQSFSRQGEKKKKHNDMAMDMDMGPLTPGSACQKQVHAFGSHPAAPPKKKAFILEVCARGQGSRVEVKA